MLGLLLILPFAFISSHKVLGHRPYYEQVAESKARLQLGADYGDYQYFGSPGRERAENPALSTAASTHAD